ncbi:MAG: hypothetical protein ACRDRG_04000 [Pseudonocardiaceae bacterium]
MSNPEEPGSRPDDSQRPRPPDKVKSDNEKNFEKAKFEQEKTFEKVKADNEKLPEKLKPEGEKVSKELEKVKSDKEFEKVKPDKEKFETKEVKQEKLEIKEQKSEKLEVKEQKFEIEKVVPEKGIPEDKAAQEGPSLPIDRETLMRHADALESMGRELRHFIEESERPDLSRGALRNEPDQEDGS